MNIDIETLTDVLKSSNGIALNANDFFNTSCADMVLLEYEDFKWAMPIIKKYGTDGENAVMSKIANTKPLRFYINDNFNKALSEINEQDIEVFSEY